MNRDFVIYLVANHRSQRDCANLVCSIRAAGCKASIILIPFGGRPVDDQTLLEDVQVLDQSDFPTAGREFVEEIGHVLSDCPAGFLRRFLAFWGPFERFIYSDNDIVALSNWDEWFEMTSSYDLVHADEEYTTEGKYNFVRPSVVPEILGEGALNAAITAGHFAARRSEVLVKDMQRALVWMQTHSEICKMHDQTLMHVAALLGNWNCLNLCKPPHNWLSSWAGDYSSPLALIQAGQTGRRISHLHFSGFGPHCYSRAVDPLKLSYLPDVQRNRILASELVCDISGLRWLQSKWKRAKYRAKRYLKHSK